MAGKRILLVEGSDDEHVIRAIFRNRGLPLLTGIKALGGIEPLLESFPMQLRESDIEALGIIVDADTQLADRWRAIRDRLSQAGYPDVPAEPEMAGTILDPPADTLLPRVGVWLMPDNRTTGILEDFLRFLVPVGDELLPHAEAALDSLPGASRFKAAYRPKALIHTYLAWQEEPGRPLGQSITARFLHHEVPEVDVFVAWLRMLFFP